MLPREKRPFIPPVVSAGLKTARRDQSGWRTQGEGGGRQESNNKPRRWGSGKEDWGAGGDCTGTEEDATRQRAAVRSVQAPRDSAKRRPLYPQGQEKPQMLRLSLRCAPPGFGSGSGWTAGDYSLRRVMSLLLPTPTLLCETDSQISPPPIKLTNHPPFPGSERQKRSSCIPKLTGNSAQKAREESFKRPWNSCQSTRWRRRQSQQASRNSQPYVCKELTSIGSWGGHELFQLNPTWNHLQPRGRALR